MSQGAFSISFCNVGADRRGSGSSAGQHFKVTCGRITALHSVPMQIKWEDIRHLCEPTIEQSNIQKWLKDEFQGSCPQKVLSINEERTVDWYLHFQVPQKLEATFPKQVCLEGKRILVEHALPFAPVWSNISRPPVEESMHEHWRNTANLAPAQKKNRSNCIAHVEDCFPSIRRVSMLQEISIQSRGLKFTGSFEASSSPFLFINGVPKVEDGLQSFVSVTSGLTDIAADVDHSVEKYLQRPSSIYDVSSHSVVLYVLSVQCAGHVPLNIGRIVVRRNGCLVSATELLKCHASTEWLLLVMLPKGIRIEGFCTPKRHWQRHFKVTLRIPIRSPKEELFHCEASPLTSLGDNPTQFLDHSRASSQDNSARKSDKGKFEATYAPRKEPLGPVANSGAAESHELKNGVAKFPQPVAVDGCGGTSPLVEVDQGGPFPVAPTAEWTEKPKNSVTAESHVLKDGVAKFPQPRRCRRLWGHFTPVRS